ncbi:hypothetical protein GGS23DRAFT_420293 [Durotheca rogersii]|uniref:uncharacterized protein n=1 Tax=Durotheca rogersii TaxID=419775 RepID=UPI00221EA769|nr:uncharacterized protein GGS23DRAFT_420293 [Durotheca rogersii]KAI5865295.1 hypothetical protein GGS23DRAFT_420293 [Durotheca rogersii]
MCVMALPSAPEPGLLVLLSSLHSPTLSPSSGPVPSDSNSSGGGGDGNGWGVLPIRVGGWADRPPRPGSSRRRTNLSLAAMDVEPWNAKLLRPLENVLNRSQTFPFRTASFAMPSTVSVLGLSCRRILGLSSRQLTAFRNVEHVEHVEHVSIMAPTEERPWHRLVFPVSYKIHLGFLDHDATPRILSP